ncbi:hypothetical protein ABB05_20355 [Lederbergia galactosidilytica]|uniref:Glycoside hydrolase 123 catalytic domain-containing protein n=2 Tax=Lederbergia galactosidilytica TaxID=217031 RepID=A0A177ZI40_9BACI|nr:hypothetical protein ABB05_20355 [Lederbergia galactosidilytica]
MSEKNLGGIMMQFQLTDSLEKVFPDKHPRIWTEKSASLFQNEQYSFQIAYQHVGTEDSFVQLQAETDAVAITLSHVKNVPSDLPAYPDRHDDNYLSIEPGLYPDLLEPIRENKIKLQAGGWNAIWIDVQPKQQVSGEQLIKIKLLDEKGQCLYEDAVNIFVYPYELPKQKLIHTEWFHGDCLADYYQVEVFSEKHWEILENFIQAAGENGVNMLLTPIFTPPLDTEVGGERTTIQLVQMEYQNGKYIFDFSLLKRWLEICERHHIKYLEMAHLFTQWGAEFTPKIIVKEDGKLTKKFGWHVKADSEEYQEFLQAFLPELTSFLKENWEVDKVYFHISDEPGEAQLSMYAKAKEMVIPYLTEFSIVDALSDYDFYEKGVVAKPIVASNHIQPFIEHQVPGLWTYYCCSQNIDVSNRFMAMPSARNRIIATQLFKYDIEGFLQWGFNFYNSQFSKKAINPYEITDAGKAFPSGDAFLVYPGENGKAYPSIRLRVFYQALQDLRAFNWLATLSGKETVLSKIEKQGEITFSVYPKDGRYLFTLREEVNQAIIESLKYEQIK